MSDDIYVRYSLFWEDFAEYKVFFKNEKVVRRISLHLEKGFFKKELWSEEDPHQFERAVEAVKKYVARKRAKEVVWFEERGFEVPSSVFESPFDYPIQAI